MIAIVCAIVLLYPVLASPITADDRYWYLGTAALSDDSFVKLLHVWWQHIPARTSYGRVNVLTELERRVPDWGIMQASIATSTPIAAYQALLKVLLMGGGIATVLAFIRSLRWRATDGTLVRASRRTLILVSVAGTLAVAVGVQAQMANVNGWTAYPVSTYGAVITIFGSIALLLWLTRLVAERSKRVLIAAVFLLALLAFITNFRYELVFPAIPLAAIALVIVPVTTRDQQAAGRRAKFITGLAYFGTFIPVFIATRVYVSHVCADNPCYAGVQMRLGGAAIRTAVFNFASAIPGFGGNELLADLDKVGWANRYPVLPTWWSVLAGLGALSAILIIWWAMQDREGEALGPATQVTRPHAQRQAEALLLAVGAGLSLLVALSAAAVMGLSVKSQGLISQPGIPYRNVVVSWVGLAFCLVLVVVAFDIVGSGRKKVLATWTALAVTIGAVAALYLPGNLMALRVARITHAFTESINWEVVKGDTTPAGQVRRCQLYERIDHEIKPAYRRESLKSAANSVFTFYHGQPFCSQPGSRVSPGGQSLPSHHHPPATKYGETALNARWIDVSSGSLKVYVHVVWDRARPAGNG